jgi:hypothetical protein
MGAAGAFKHPGDEDVVFPKPGAADRADPVPSAVEAVNAASYVHKPVFSPIKRRESRRFDQFAPIQFGGAYRAGVGGAGVAFSRSFASAPPP